MKKKTILVAAIAVMLVAALVVGGTLAYFTDKDNATNTFTVGNVDIELLESSLHRENAGYVGTPGEELNPQNAELWSEVLKQGSNNTSPYKAGDTFYTDDQMPRIRVTVSSLLRDSLTTRCPMSRTLVPTMLISASA